MSTAVERIMRARGDLECLHEPFMYDYYINRSKRVMPHFDAQADHPRSYEAIRNWILDKAERGPVFFKDMSYYVVPHILEDTAFMQRLTHSFLLRDPVASITSYVKLDPDLTLEEIGIESQWQHAAWLVAHGGKPVVVLSEALQADPIGQMRAYWDAVGLDDKPAALEWEDAAPEDWKQVSGWHKDVMASKTIRPVDEAAQAKAKAEFAKLGAEKPHLRGYLDHHTKFHRLLADYAV